MYPRPPTDTSIKPLLFFGPHADRRAKLGLRRMLQAQAGWNVRHVPAAAACTPKLQTLNPVTKRTLFALPLLPPLPPPPLSPANYISNRWTVSTRSDGDTGSLEAVDLDPGAMEEIMKIVGQGSNSHVTPRPEVSRLSPFLQLLKAAFPAKTW
jgi:hypothetical protein